MTGNDMAASATEHPAPHRERVGIAALLFSLFGAPIAWSGHELLNYGLASYVCYPSAAPRTAILPHWQWIRPVLLAIDLIAIGIAAAAAIIAYRSWAATRRESSGHAHHLVDVGEGRTRFLALCGMLVSVGFMLAIGLDIIALFVVPLCGR